MLHKKLLEIFIGKVDAHLLKAATTAKKTMKYSFLIPTAGNKRYCIVRHFNTKLWPLPID